MNNPSDNQKVLRAGMIGMGMIFDETYRPLFESLHSQGLYRPATGIVQVPFTSTGSRTGRRAQAYKDQAGSNIADFAVHSGDNSVADVLNDNVDFVCVATPDDRHFEPASQTLAAGKHLLIEKPSVLSLGQLDQLTALARENNVLARVVYHKLFDPDHKKLRTLVYDGELSHVNSGYCTLLEPKLIGTSQFAEWIQGRNPGTYVAVHYIKLIDFTFGGRLTSVSATGQRGIVSDKGSDTWDSVQIRMTYEYSDGREAAFDIHTSWVTPDNFPGYVEQEVQFRFDNGVWNGHSRKRGVELTVEGKTPITMKTSINNHYNGSFVEPWNTRSQRGYGLEAIGRFVEEVAFVEFGGPAETRPERLAAIQELTFSDLTADRQTVAVVQATEAILERHAQGSPNCVVHVNHADGGLVLFEPGQSQPTVLYQPEV